MTTTETPVDNGVNVEALLGVRGRVGRHPGDRPVPVACDGVLGQRHAQPLRRRDLLRASARSSSTRRRSPSTSTTRCSSPREDNGVTPVEYVLVALGGCLTAGIAAVAQQREIQLRSVQATVEAEMDLHGILGADPDVRNGFSGVTVELPRSTPTPPPRRSRRWSRSRRSARRSTTSSPTRPASRSTSPDRSVEREAHRAEDDHRRGRAPATAGWP